MSFLLYETGIVHHTSCMDIIESLPENFIPACITDFPYGINFQSNRRENKFDKIDNDEEPYIEWIYPLYNKMQDEGRFITFYRYDVQDVLFDAINKAGFEIKSQLVWDKGTWSSGDLKSAVGLQHELMVYATKGKYEFKNGRPNSIYRCPRVASISMIHPNEKPVELNRKLIVDFTTPGEILFEPFSGSASLCVASKLEGREFIACDTQERNVKIGNERLAKTIKSFV